MYLKINGLNLHLEDSGNPDGLPLVFLHSWAGSARSWTYVVDALPLLSRIPHAEMVIIPATGHLSPLESPIEVAELITRFLAQMLGQKL